MDRTRTLVRCGYGLAFWGLVLYFAITIITA